MASQWPPSPFVEDEEAALAHEHLLDATIHKAESEDQPAGNRGSVNQYPIILDVDEKDTNKDEPAAGGAHSSDESCGPRTPPPVERERSSVRIRPDQPKTTVSKSEKPSSRSKSRSKSRSESRSKSQVRTDRRESPRGRPNVSRIKTDVGSDLHEMITGHRRAPSPYAYKSSTMSAKPEPARRFSGEQLLSPRSATFPQGNKLAEPKRASSSRPRSDRNKIETSTDSDEQQERRRHHSRRRSTRQSFAAQERPRPHFEPPKVDRQTGPQISTPVGPGIPTTGLSSQAAPQYPTTYQAPTRRYSKESPYASSAEETSHRHSHHRGHTRDQRSSGTSPNVSGEENRSNKLSQNVTSPKSRRGSMRSSQRPNLENLSHHYSYGGWESPVGKTEGSLLRHDVKHHSVFDGRTYLEPTTPASSRSPQDADSFWEKAFQENKSKRSSQVTASPRMSPSSTPPKTPRGDRRSKDFYEPPQSLSQPPQRSSRVPSLEQNQFRTSTNGLVTGATGALGVTSIPSLSRTSTASLDAPSSGSISNFSSGQRSRKPSPVYEDPRPVSRSGSFNNREEHLLPRPATLTKNDERPLSRGGLSIQTGMDHPRLAQRSLSYNSAVDQATVRPSSSQRMSSSLLPAIGMTELNPQIGRSKVSPSTVDNSHSATLDIAPLPMPPPCPRSTPRAGLTDWYTIKGTSQIDICPSCMGTLGSSRFRDSFVPSLAKPRNQEVKCSMSNPWFRVAWRQIGEQQRPTLEMLRLLAQVPPSSRPCPGKKFEVRPWFRMTDPATGKAIPNFEVCSACAYAVDTVFPCLRGVLERISPSPEERGCNLNVESRRFSKFIYEFNKAHARCDGEKYRKSDVQALADHARRTSRVRECARDGPLLTAAWHFMPELPDFTICEECYEEVVWPVADRPVARNVNRTLKLPVARPGRFVNGRTCQLYSERMRKVFKDAVLYNDFEALRTKAMKRLEVELLLQEKHQLLMSEIRAGYDRTAEIERNSHIWSTWE